LFFQGYNSRDVKLTTHLHIVPKLRMEQLYLHSPYVVMGWGLLT
jgi:hypothetical protein